MIKGAIFDVDGTLLDSMTCWDHASENYLKSLGKTPEEHLEEKMFSMSMEKGAEYMKKAYNLDLETSQIIEGVNNTIARFYKYEAKAKKGVLELLDKFREADIKMTVATSTDRQHIEAALCRLNLLSYFQQIFTCSEVGVGKIKPDIYLLAAKKMGTDINQTIVLEDAYHGAKTAYMAGFKVAGIYDKSSEKYQEKLKDYCHIYINDFQTNLYNILNYCCK